MHHADKSVWHAFKQLGQYHNQTLARHLCLHHEHACLENVLAAALSAVCCAHYLPLPTVVAEHCRVFARSHNLKMGVTLSSKRYSSMYERSCANTKFAMCTLSFSFKATVFRFIVRTRLYKHAKHFRWYLASKAIKSLTKLNFVSILLSCNLLAQSLILWSTSKVITSRSGSESLSGLSQNKTFSQLAVCIFEGLYTSALTRAHS
jgi:hypothetical protein